MILERKCFKLKDQCVIEKLLIRTPFRYGAVFENEACFLHIKEGEGLLISPTERLKMHISESVLLQCGNYFADLIQHSPNNKQCQVIAVHLHRNILLQIYKDQIPSFFKPANKKSFAQKIEARRIIHHFIDSLDFYFQHPTLVNDQLLELKLKELIILLLQTNSAENISSLFAHLFTPRQADFQEVIQAHLFEKTSISELAVLTGRSLSAFKRDFEQYFNDSPAHFIRKQKLKKAKELLELTDFSVNEICYQVGFQDSSHFCKLFKQMYALSPTSYRKKLVSETK